MKRTLDFMTQEIEPGLIRKFQPFRRCVSPMSGYSPTSVMFTPPPSPPTSICYPSSMNGNGTSMTLLPETVALPSPPISLISDEFSLTDEDPTSSPWPGTYAQSSSPLTVREASQMNMQSLVVPNQCSCEEATPTSSMVRGPPQSCCRRHRRNTTELVGSEGLFMKASATHCSGAREEFTIL